MRATFPQFCPRGEGMDIPETKVHSFIVKLWLEEADDETGKAVWHGYVTHVPDGERRYLKRLIDLIDFIKCYLEDVGDERRQESWFRRLLRNLDFSRAGRFH
jgi:hypothetical protein